MAEWRLPPQDWNYHDYDGPRTNNHLEGWHNRLNRIVGKAHPNVYKLIEVFQREEAAVSVTISQLEAGGRAPPRKRKAVEMDRRITELQRKLSDGEFSIQEYVEAIKYQTGL